MKAKDLKVGSLYVAPEFEEGKFPILLIKKTTCREYHYQQQTKRVDQYELHYFTCRKEIVKTFAYEDDELKLIEL